MVSLKWNASDAVWIDEVDDEHREIFEAIAGFEELLSKSAPAAGLRKSLERLTNAIAGHFAHEERLMHASRYHSLTWHKRLHAAATRKVRDFTTQMERGDRLAGRAMVKYLKSWLHHHTRVADRMMGAHLRNQRRSLGRVVFRAGTKAAEACSWIDSQGKRFNPLAPPDNL